MAKIDFWALAERVPLELGERVELMAPCWHGLA